ncbi:MAG: DUF4976 domain-containing protein [Caldilineae bacterium]|nr:MAG: DUF4976 domain-containing protein [Caldilineae bacterium]
MNGCNVLFLLTDQWRQDALGFLGHPLAYTPNLDRLAAGAVFFRNAFTAVPLCSPARGCLLSGRWPHQNGVQDNVGVGASQQEGLSAQVRTWLEAACDQGYQVGYFGKWHLGQPDPAQRGARFSSETDHHLTPPRGPEAARATADGRLRPPFQHDWETDLAHRRPDYFPPFYAVAPGSMEDTDTGKTAAAAIHFLQETSARPWFLTVSFRGPHFPHAVPEPYAHLVDPSRVILPDTLQDDFHNKPWFQNRVWWPCHDTSHLDEEDWRKTAAAYYGMIAMLDAAIGRVLTAAARASGGRPTVILFASDHGEMLGAHGRFDKGPYFYDEVMRIPLLIRLPEAGPLPAEANEKPHIRDEFVSILDLGATLFHLAGERPSLPGRDLVSLLQGDSTQAWPQEAFGWYTYYNGHSFAMRCIRTPDYKYVFNPQSVDELYDLRTDPGEMNNLALLPAHASTVAALRGRLFAWMEQEHDPLRHRWQQLPPAGALVSGG